MHANNDAFAKVSRKWDTFKSNLKLSNQLDIWQFEIMPNTLDAIKVPYYAYNRFLNIILIQHLSEQAWRDFILLFWY